jgi:hypothetical protein
MKTLIAALCSLALLALPTLAADETEFSGKGKAHFEAPIAMGVHLRMHVRSGDIRIVGGDGPRLSVDLSGKKVNEIDDVKYRLRNTGNSSEFSLSGGPKNDLQITIHIPRNVELYVRVLAGDLTIEGITGSKDVELHFGDLTIEAGNPADYSHVEASVNAGDISAAPFGEDHGGLFRSFHKSGPGKYTLYAHVGAGDLTLK